MRKFILISCVTFGLACSGKEPKLGQTDNQLNIEQTDNQAGHVNFDTTKTAIIPWDFEYPFDNLDYKPGSLSQNDLDQVEASLITTVVDYNNSLSPGHDDYKIDLNANQYRKQLVAVLNQKGEKEVWVNCFCDARDESWRTEIVVVFDGGPCFFSFKLNLATKRTYELMVNGFA